MEYSERERKMCGCKPRHSTKAIADKEVKLMKKTGAATTDTLHSYQCPFCHFWHIGNRWVELK